MLPSPVGGGSSVSRSSPRDHLEFLAKGQQRLAAAQLHVVEEGLAALVLPFAVAGHDALAEDGADLLSDKIHHAAAPRATASAVASICANAMSRVVNFCSPDTVALAPV